MALLTIASDIGQTFRATEIFTRPQFNSMMAWMVWLYTAYFLVLLAELFFAFRVEFDDWKGTATSGFKHAFAKLVLLGKNEESESSQKRDAKILKTLALIGIPLAVAFHGGVGSLFATVATQAIWHSPLTPILFVLGALFSGGALLTGLLVFFWPKKDSAWNEVVHYLGQVLFIMGMIYALFEWAEYSIPLWYGYGDTREIQSLNSLLYGQYWWVFWVFQVLTGTLIPIALFYFGRKRPAAIGVGGLMVALSFLAVRLDIVVPAYVAPQISGFSLPNLGLNFSYSYFPNLFEWQFLAFVVALGIGILILGYNLLPLVTKNKSEKVPVAPKS
jgi:molybdopterin-containing oxidoreductase family membrane subunit